MFCSLWYVGRISVRKVIHVSVNCVSEDKSPQINSIQLDTSGTGMFRRVRQFRSNGSSPFIVTLDQANYMQMPLKHTVTVELEHTPEHRA